MINTLLGFKIVNKRFPECLFALIDTLLLRGIIDRLISAWTLLKGQSDTVKRLKLFSALFF